MGNKTRLWITIIGCVIVALFVINLLRVNPPAASPEMSPTPEPALYTRGQIVSGNVAIEPGAFLQYRMNFNYRSTIKGGFKVPYGKPWLTCLILNESNFEKWKAGEEFATVVSTGKVPSGKVSRRVEPGVYFLVVDNRDSKDKQAFAEVDFTAE